MKRICVYCGSSLGRLPDYEYFAREMGLAMLEQGIGLVYGGASIGLMGEIADTVIRGGGEVIGVIPKHLQNKEPPCTNLTKLEVVETMHERKTRMAQYSDGFIALPGGLGTIEELFEVLTWNQLGFHNKPCGILNVSGYFDSLLTFIEHATNNDFMRPQHRHMLLVKREPRALLDALLSYEFPISNKWELECDIDITTKKERQNMHSDCVT